VVLKSLEPRLLTRLVNGTNLVITSRYAVLKHKVPLDRWQQITQAVARLSFGLDERKLRSRQRLQLRAIRNRGVFAVDDYLRRYPNGSLAAHVLGLVASGENEKDEGLVREDHGLAGLEATFDTPLNGTHGWETRDGRVPPKPGQDIVLTLDAGIQYIVETELARLVEKHHPAGAIGLVLDPRTGDVLALANWPVYDPNRPGTNNAAFRNRAVMDQYEPGSTFKAVSLGASLERGVITLADTVFCENGFWGDGFKLRDHHPYGMLTYLQVIAKSSNIGAAKAARRLGAPALHESILNFGFGALTLIPLPGEEKGRVRPLKNWQPMSLTRVPIGQEITATPLQMTLAFAAIANGGVWVPPRLVKHFTDAGGAVVAHYPVEAPRRALGEAAAREITTALKSVVSPDGTGKRAILEHYTAAGKTGTAQKIVGGVYSSTKYYASFIGFLPADRPELCILVGVDEPEKRLGYEGGIVAAPAFKPMAERIASYLRIEPDIVPEPTSPEPDQPSEIVVNRALALHGTPNRAAVSSRR
jgi:cell division protein FtsI/penicillin-binding protein 2